ncbi:19072_t:CDS:1, partial [Rhizophagus irregularis]
MAMRTLLEVQYNLLDIDYYKTGNISINGKYTTIDFSDLNNN